MSLLSDTQGSPERVWSLLGLLTSHGGELERDQVLEWLVPTIRRVSGGSATLTALPNRSAAQQTIGAAVSLGLVESSSNLVRLLLAEVPANLDTFRDLVYSKLLQTTANDPDYLILEVFCWYVVRCESLGGTEWASELTRDAIADGVVKDLQTTDRGADRIFNATKVPFWRNWATFVGLGIEFPISSTPSFHPYVYSRLATELKSLADTLGYDKELEATSFLDALALRMPYLDRGAMFRALSAAMKLPVRQSQISLILSTAIRELHDEGKLTVNAPGDATGTVQLAPDLVHKLKYIKTVTINRISSQS